MPSLVELRLRAHPNSMAWRKAALDARVLGDAAAHGAMERFGAAWATVDKVDPPARPEALFDNPKKLAA